MGVAGATTESPDSKHNHGFGLHAEDAVKHALEMELVEEMLRAILGK